MQVKVRHMTGNRYVVTCNGRPVPLAPTGTHGEYVAGVRYRAWQPPSALHPTIRRAFAAGVRPARRVERALDRRLHLPRRASRRAQLRDAFRSTPMKPRRVASRASPPMATRRVRFRGLGLGLLVRFRWATLPVAAGSSGRAAEASLAGARTTVRVWRCDAQGARSASHPGRTGLSIVHAFPTLARDVPSPLRSSHVNARLNLVKDQ